MNHHSKRAMLSRFATLLVALVLLAPQATLAGPPEAQSQYQEATAAYEAENYERALSLLERAFIEDGRGLYMYQRAVVLEAMGEPQLALDVLQEHRETIESDPEVEGLSILEQRLVAKTNGEVSGEHSVGGQTDWLGWSLVGGGTAVTATGAVLLVVAEGEAERLRCSPSSSNPDKSGCDGVDAYGALSSAEFASKSDDVSLYRYAGIGATAVGLAAVGWGVWRLVDSEAPAEPAASRDATQWYVGTDNGHGVRAGFRLRF